MDISAVEQRAAAAAQDQSAGAVAVGPKLADEFVDALAGIAFALACYELAGKEPPDFGQFSEGEPF